MHAPMPAKPDPTSHHLGVVMNLFLGKEKEKEAKQEGLGAEMKKESYKWGYQVKKSPRSKT